MSSVNRVILVGRLGVDPVLKETPVGNVVNFTLATNESWVDKQTGVKQEKTEWHKVNVWGNQTAAVAKFLKKGSLAYIEGRLQTRKFEKDGQTKYVTEVKADSVQFLDSKDKSVPEVITQAMPPAGSQVDFDSDIPF